MKSKQSQQNQFEMKVKLISSLMVIDALVNFKSANALKQVSVAKENYYNAIRVLVLRDGSLSQGFPPTFIKLANDLLSEVVDVTSPSNSEIIRKSIDIILILGDFILI